VSSLITQIGLEYVADVCDFAGGTYRSHADPPSGYEVIDQCTVQRQAAP